MDNANYIELIEQLIRDDNLTAQSPALGGVLVRAYQQFCENRDSISALGNDQQSLQEFEREISQLKLHKQSTQQSLAMVMQHLDDLRKNNHKETADLTEKLENVTATLTAVQTECQTLQTQLDEWNDKPKTAEQLQYRLNTLNEEKKDILRKVDLLGTTADDNRRTLDKLRPLVHNLEDLETKMDKVMDSLWGNLKKDTFDAIFQNQ